MIRVVISTGGTGGHVFPALAVADVLREQGAECLFIGSQYGLEAKWVAEAGIDFIGLPVRGVLGRGLRAVGALGNMALAIVKARSLLLDFKPDAVAGFGGYASFAALSAAYSLGIPILVHEQNAWPGLTNRLIGRIAKKICLSMPQVTQSASAASGFDNKKCVVTGNPVRKSFLNTKLMGEYSARDDNAPHLLVLGGSLGARAINSLVLGGINRLFEAGIKIRHQTGDADIERVRAGYGAYGFSTDGIEAFITDMPRAYAWADMVLCRSGASTVAELAVCGKPAIFIPFPYATHDHQTCNARAVCSEGAAIMFSESELAREDVPAHIISLINNKESMEKMSRAALSMARPEAADNVAGEILGLMSEKGTGKENTETAEYKQEQSA